MRWWIRLIHKNPYTIIIFSLFLTTCCIFYTIHEIRRLDFSDPQSGFEARGTDIGCRLTTWQNIVTELRSQKTLVPFLVAKKHRFNGVANRIRRETSLNLCGNPILGYSRIVVRNRDVGDIFRLKHLLRLCQLEEAIIALSSMRNVCEVNYQAVNQSDYCCSFWSLSNYVALVANRTHCSQLQRVDVGKFKRLLQKCWSYFANGSLQADCVERNDCRHLPQKCVRFNAVFNTFQYLLPAEWNDTDLTVVYLPVAQGAAILHFYLELQDSSIFTADNHLEIVAADFGLKESLFDYYLVVDLKLIIGSCIVVVTALWIYTDSLFITHMTILAMVGSLAITYVIYVEMFRIEFFPFMNMLSVVLAVGIGADDVFIYYKYWKANRFNDRTLEANVRRLQLTAKHALPAMWLTSLTTALTFYASSCSSITAIRCFSLFVGTVVLVNYLVVTTWLAACSILNDRWYTASIPTTLKYYFHTRFFKSYTLNPLAEAIDRIILNFRWYFTLVLTFIVAISSLIVWYTPQLHLPNTQDFQLFKQSHLFEQYDLNYRHRFRSEQKDRFQMPLHFVWGVLATDTGDHLNPLRRGTLVFDTSFNLSQPDAQEWLLAFCQKVKVQPFYRFTMGPQLLNCFIENFVVWMRRPCHDRIDNTDYSPCCNKSAFPYQAHVFLECVDEYFVDLYRTPMYLGGSVAGVKFDSGTRRPKLLLVEVPSNYSFTFAHSEMHEFYQMVNSWFVKELEKAPATLANGWFVSELGFYDLQTALVFDTYLALGCSTVITFIVVLLVTRHLALSLLTMVTVLCSLHVIVAILILLDWRLNILESIALTSSIGLTVDFALHYALALSVRDMFTPTTITCLTTVSAGLCMMPSQVLGYQQIGTFLVVAMLVSWTYSTFYFGAVLAIVKHDLWKVNTDDRIIEMQSLVPTPSVVVRIYRCKSWPIITQTKLIHTKSLPSLI